MDPGAARCSTQYHSLSITAKVSGFPALAALAGRYCWWCCGPAAGGVGEPVSDGDGLGDGVGVVGVGLGWLFRTTVSVILVLGGTRVPLCNDWETTVASCTCG